VVSTTEINMKGLLCYHPGRVVVIQSAREREKEREREREKKREEDIPTPPLFLSFD